MLRAKARQRKQTHFFFANSAESLPYTYSTDPLFDYESVPSISSATTVPVLNRSTAAATTKVPVSSAVPALNTSAAATVPAPVTTTGTITKRTHERAISSISSPPRKYNVPHNPSPVLCSPDRNNLKMALKIGGGADLDMKQVSKFQTENIHFYSIPAQQLNDLLKCTRHHSFSVDNADSSVGYMTVDMSPEGCISIGGFKTAHAGWLTLMSPPTAGLGSRARHDVVVKRPFYKVYPKSAVGNILTAALQRPILRIISDETRSNPTLSRALRASDPPDITGDAPDPLAYLRKPVRPMSCPFRPTPLVGLPIYLVTYLSLPVTWLNIPGSHPFRTRFAPETLVTRFY
ncbi:hypothetical protein EDB19DRAFT_1916526 [Suillus lakei]|nr:hypothetical protein EDB19DRAFT_1916526 [Suillus lakei]